MEKKLASPSQSAWRDSDPQETLEWLESFDAVLDAGGAGRGQEILCALTARARRAGIRPEYLLDTSFQNTIPRSEQPDYPGDLKLEQRISAIIRWNAIAMVVRANRQSGELGGHLASYASAADLFEVGFQHFFRGESAHGGDRTGDLIYFQPHSAPGIYARAFLEGRLTEDQLDHYRREAEGRGLPSYPHPRLLPEFWQFPTGSMGLGPLTAVYQARLMRYLEYRGLMPNTGRRVWAFVGDGEMDEPESLAGLSIAAREGLDHLTFVVNCNLQRLDGPVRGNGSIVQELERLFAGAGWNVVKLLWGSDWDELFARDSTDALLERFARTTDGELQSYAAHDAAFNRERFFGENEALRSVAAPLTDEALANLTRGGHDPVKVYAAFHAAVRSKGKPTVVLALTKKGYGLGPWAEGKMAAHQQKKLGIEALRYFRDRFELPISDADLTEARYYRPASSTPEMNYLHERRQALGGYLPARKTSSIPTSLGSANTFAPFHQSSGEREISTTIAFVRMLTALLKEAPFSRQIVPIVADEARTFGMESLFGKIGIYSPCGQLYEPADQDTILYYKEAKDGQLLEEGITEAGALSSWIAAGTAYSTHGRQLVPFYIYYSIFGFQRVGDLIHAAEDSRVRGFLLGATAGRTTLSGEGLQHQDGTSHLIASTFPNCRAYDPCFAYELAVILENGLNDLAMQQDAFYYITLMNENYAHPAMPVGATEGILRGMYCLRATSKARTTDAEVQLLASGTILREALAAAELLEAEMGIAANVWSVTSFTELRREGIEIERLNRIERNPRACWVEQCLGPTTGPIIAASDYVRAVPDLIRAWVPRRYTTLGTDGYGRSDTRASLRRFFEVDHVSIAFTAISELVAMGLLAADRILSFQNRYSYYPPPAPFWRETEREVLV
jgi:pyruvate dehydrogenase E1 component